MPPEIDPNLPPAGAPISPPAGDPPAGNPPTGTPPPAPGATGTPPPAGSPPSAPAGGNPPAQQAWPEKWRETWAKEDKKRLDMVTRYASPEAALDALADAKERIARGDLRRELPANATEDQIKEWRTENGIPETPEGYTLKLDEGRVVGDHDKPLLDDFVKRMHSKNAKPEVINEAVNAYYQMREEEIREITALDASDRGVTEEALRGEYGPDGYRKNMSLVTGMLDLMGAKADLKDRLFSARMPNGTILGNDPEVLRMFVQMAYEINPTGTLLPTGGDVSMANIDKEINDLVKMSGDPNSDYWKGPHATSKQARLLELNGIKEKLEARSQGRRAA